MSPTPPSVDVGDSPGMLTLLVRELRPTPGRLGNTLRLTLFSLVTVTIGEMFRLPDILIFTYTGFIIFGNDAGATAATSLTGAIGVVVGTGVTIVVFMASLSQPALRLPLMALLTLATGFLTKGARLGHGLQILGMWVVYNLPQGDQLRQGALQQTYISGNTTSNSLPNLLFMSPEESLVHTLLWTAFEMASTVALMTLFNLVAGRDPAQVLRSSLAERLEAAAQACDGAPGSGRKLASLARQGTAALLKLQGSAKAWHPGSPRRADAESLIGEIDRLCLVVLAWHRFAGPGNKTAAGAASACRRAATSLRTNKPYQGAPEPVMPDPGEAAAASPGLLPPLAEDLNRALAEIGRILGAPSAGRRPEPSNQAKAPGGFLVADAWTNPAYSRFGVKLTIAAAFCYGAEALTNWSGVGTCLITVFVVSFESTGESVHKAALRISGCLVGALLGIGTILLLMPSMTTLADLLLVMLAPLLLASWVKTGGARSNYAGQQIAIAYFTCLLSGYGPTLDMEGARDRIVGILLGDCAVYVVFTTIWPVSVADTVRKGVGQAFERLADLVGCQHNCGDVAGDARSNKLRRDFDTAISGASASLANDPYETTRMRPDRTGPTPRHRVIDGETVASVQALMVPVAVLVGRDRAARPPDGAQAVDWEAIRGHRQAMAAWLHGCAAWVRTGIGGDDLLANLPAPLDLPGSDATGAASCLHRQAAWLGVLHEDASAMVRKIGADADRAAGNVPEGAVAAG